MILKNKKLKLGFLTSSRADFGIYKSLLNVLKNDKRFDIHIIAFGMHLEKKYGNTINEIINEGFISIIKITGILNDDSKLDTAISYSTIAQNFSKFWNKNNFDYVFCLGDRFEMSAAVQAGISFEVKFVHIHGGETSLGSIDNIYRNQISLVSKIHFTANEIFSKRLTELLGTSKNIETVGSLSLDGLDLMKIIKWKKVCKSYDIPSQNFVLTTFHPETVNLNNNILFIKELEKSLLKLSSYINLVITFPNADTLGNLYRNMYIKLKDKVPGKIFLVKSFGRSNFFSAMQASSFILGNSSSGIIEAASFKKYVINVGDRQKGRLKSKNIIDVPFDYEKIINACKKFIKPKIYKGKNEYYKSNSSKRILDYLIKINA